MGILDEIESGPNQFGHDKDGNFEGYAFRDKLNKEIMEAIELIKAHEEVDDDMRAKCIYSLNNLKLKLESLTNHEITRNTLNEYRSAAKMLFEKGTIKDRKKEIGGLVGFFIKLFK